ncbi:cytochrome c family protein [Stieleria varia]|uniref:Perchlorate reductase subunit gamma n=1 Tax=Stieleria varia TaxID=2528005 RepID=A0A5C6AY49_9BACT|nr:cytochrome c family protein [Stieleria varia]TWU04558.1 Perchlorate reductase subunit gamma precursor [Stieleria varia]
MFGNRFFSFSLATIIGTLNLAGMSSAAPPVIAEPANPHKVLTQESCVKCHAGEVGVWQKTPHATTFDTLHRTPEAKQIALKLGLQSIKHEGRCVACHYTQQSSAGQEPHVISGVSCESCHGAAKDWLDLHHDYGGESITRLTETPHHRQQRIAASVHAGMRNPLNVFAVAQSCLRCHTTADEELVNVGGHTAGSLDFEFVSWSQGTVRHNFVRSDGKANTPSSQNRLRVMFVSGMIAELEAGMRATAIATQKANYGVTAAQRTARAAARLKSVAQKVSDSNLNHILAVYDSVQLKLNNSEPLTAAADSIATAGFQFAETNDGSALGALDAFIPTPDRWK